MTLNAERVHTDETTADPYAKDEAQAWREFACGALAGGCYNLGQAAKMADEMLARYAKRFLTKPSDRAIKSVHADETTAGTFARDKAQAWREFACGALGGSCYNLDHAAEMADEMLARYEAFLDANPDSCVAKPLPE